jgi:hypothetical protein
MTIDELLSGEQGAISNRGYLATRAFYVWRAEVEKMARKEAAKGA